jgi:hypothetical protein
VTQLAYERVKAKVTSEGTDDTAALLEFLRERDVACPLCEYNLRGLLTPRCPECGRKLVLSVGLVERPLKAWITLAASLLMPAGLGVLAIISLALQGVQSVPDTLLFLLGWFILHIPFAAAAVVMRRRFLKLNAKIQWALALTALGSCAGVFATYAMILGG